MPYHLAKSPYSIICRISASYDPYGNIGNQRFPLEVCKANFSGGDSLFVTPGFVIYDPYGNRTRVTAVKGRCLNRLTKGPYSKISVIVTYRP